MTVLLTKPARSRELGHSRQSDISEEADTSEETAAAAGPEPGDLDSALRGTPERSRDSANARPRVRASDEIGAFRQLVSEIPQELLSHEEEIDLARRVKGGDEQARRRFTECNLRLVIKISRTFMGRGMALSDLIAEGTMGLMRAVEDYDPNVGTRFSTYAAYWIKERIQNALPAEGRAIRFPKWFAVAQGKLKRALRELPAEASLDDSEVRKSLLDVLRYKDDARGNKRLNLLIRWHRRGAPESLTTEEGEQAPHLEAAVADPVDEAAHREDLERLRSGIKHLADLKCRQVLIARFGLNGEQPKTLAAIGTELGLSREAVRRIEERAIDELRADRNAEPAKICPIRNGIRRRRPEESPADVRLPDDLSALGAVDSPPEVLVSAEQAPPVPASPNIAPPPADPSAAPCSTGTADLWLTQDRDAAALRETATALLKYLDGIDTTDQWLPAAAIRHVNRLYWFVEGYENPPPYEARGALFTRIFESLNVVSGLILARVTLIETGAPFVRPDDPTTLPVRAGAERSPESGVAEKVAHPGTVVTAGECPATDDSIRRSFLDRESLLNAIRRADTSVRQAALALEAVERFNLPVSQRIRSILETEARRGSRLLTTAELRAIGAAAKTVIAALDFARPKQATGT